MIDASPGVGIGAALAVHVFVRSDDTVGTHHAVAHVCAFADPAHDHRVCHLRTGSHDRPTQEHRPHQGGAGTEFGTGADQ
jgi:hypothetical protein